MEPVMLTSQVVQSPIKDDKGMTVYFKPKAAEQVEITESTSLNIEFYDGDVCNNIVCEVEGYPGTYENPVLLSNNGVKGNSSTWFQIKKFNGGDLDAYKLSCVNEIVWKVDAPDPEGIRFVVTGGNPGPDTINNWFKVEKFITTMPGYNYRLRHCPVQFLCPLCNINDCRDVGAKADSGYDRLAVTNQPIPFGFDKVRNKDA
ncbi:hypothetical protein HAX54_032842 [Datura stramonium]|uniref:Uncharacterized protein n=1 Tax=Datura stramonium TaxID=4076 RepID=A0ABS8VEQ9_DATST|nr:hypothetical protein [Datura stramonium]